MKWLFLAALEVLANLVFLYPLAVQTSTIVGDRCQRAWYRNAQEPIRGI